MKPIPKDTKEKKGNQFNIIHYVRSNLFSVEIKGIKFTFSDKELELLELLIHKILVDHKDL